MGLPITYLILRFVTFYYYIFAAKNRIAISSFYLEALRIPKNKVNQLTRKNFYYFGQVLIDRFAFLIGKGDNYSYTFNNEQYLIDMNHSGKGGILLSGHVGNWETAGNLLKSRITSKVNVLMYDEEVQKIKKYTDATTGGSHFNVIPIKNDISHVIKVHQALKRNEFIAIHADRYMEGSKYIELDFLGF